MIGRRVDGFTARGGAARILPAFLIGIHERPQDHPISAQTIERSIVIGGTFAAHARIMYRVMAGRSGQSLARQVLEVIRELGTPTTKRDIHRKLRGRAAFVSSGDVSAPLELLEEYGWIRRERQTGERGGRPSESIILNPLQPMDKTDKTPSAYPELEVLGVLSMLPGEQDAVNEASSLSPTGTEGDADDWEF